MIVATGPHIPLLCTEDTEKARELYYTGERNQHLTCFWRIALVWLSSQARGCLTIAALHCATLYRTAWTLPPCTPSLDIVRVRVSILCSLYSIVDYTKSKTTSTTLRSTSYGGTSLKGLPVNTYPYILCTLYSISSTPPYLYSYPVVKYIPTPPTNPKLSPESEGNKTTQPNPAKTKRTLYL